MSRRRPAAIGFVGPSGSGKTTLIERLLPMLRERGRSVGVVKHHGHPIELDTEGKDTWRFRQAGAVTTALVGENQLALFGAGADGIAFDQLLDCFYRNCEVVLVEGFRAADLPSIVVARAALPEAWTRPTAPIATATDPQELLQSGEPVLASLPSFHLDDVAALTDFIESTV